MDKSDIVEIPIPVGMLDKRVIKVDGKGNEHPEARTGDFHAHIYIKPHKVFKRKGNNLYLTQKVSLIEALQGFSFNLKLLNGLEVTINTPKGKIVTHKETMRIPNLGMPHLDNSMTQGDLFIEFDVIFPKQLSHDQIEQLQKALPGPILGQVKKTKNTYLLEQSY